MELSHVDAEGKAFMVDVSGKNVVRRTASAYAKIVLHKETINLVRANLMKKGDVLTAAKIAGIAAAKKTDELIPLCHCLSLEHADIVFNVMDDGIEIVSSVVATGKTGVEMEALSAVAVSALTVYDMCKAVDKNMKIENIHLREKKKEEIK